MHTLDDHPGGRVSWSGGGGSPSGAEEVHAYARELLQTAVSRGVEVLGLAPHAVYSAGDPALSAVWAIVEVWNSEANDDGTPFRDLIYSVFPGFEPTMADGSRGVHLIYLFDPEIGKDQFIRAFHAVMNGVNPWDGGSLQLAGRGAKEAFELLANMWRDGSASWSWLCIAPHAFSGQRGLFGQLKSQMLEHFPHPYLAALELSDSELPADAFEGREPWLREGMERYHHAFIHASDAYAFEPNAASTRLEVIGARTTYVKMASPRIEALRQAFLAADSRVRLTLTRDLAGSLVAGTIPSPLADDRPWLRSVVVSGGTSFFGGQEDGTPRAVEFRFNPDLTCIIGGRMAGKSTLLDGLRVALGFALPKDGDVRADVEGRARDQFQSGSPEIAVDIRGPVAETEPEVIRWPADFYTQRELQQAVRDQQGLRRLLYQLVPGQTANLNELEASLASMTAALGRMVPRIEESRRDLALAQQRAAASEAAKVALERFEAVGAAALSEAQADIGRVAAARGAVISARDATVAATTLSPGPFAPPTTGRVQAIISAEELSELQQAVVRAMSSVGEAQSTLDRVVTRLDELLASARNEVENLRAELEQALAAAGGTAEELNQFTALSARAESFESDRIAVSAAQDSYDGSQRRFGELLARRAEVRVAHRGAVAVVAREVEERFGGGIRIAVVENGIRDQLDDWVATLRERGVTRWWHDSEHRNFSPEEILAALIERDLTRLGMSEQVADTFAETMTEGRRNELAGLLTPDRYVLEHLLDDGDYRPMNRLSGGQQVSLLLTLLLQTGDERPLVIDQPEEELDKSYLFTTVLPSLRALKGRRQVIFVTHDANIVVNGDADQVIYLKADSKRGWVAAAGAIEQPEVRQAILTVLDGGEDAFEMRYRKYGF